jgi:hypothetical protein
LENVDGPPRVHLSDIAQLACSDLSLLRNF